MSTPSSCNDRAPEIHRALANWFGNPVGEKLAVAEQEMLEHFAESLFGYYLVQIDTIANDSVRFENCPIRHKLHVSAAADDAECDLCALGEQLPLQNDFLDAVVLRHTLDFSVDPQQLLREVERVLIPEGRVLIVGFNPLSLWGVWRLFLGWRGHVPWCGHFLSYRRVADWLGLLGFDIEYTDVAAFTPPLPPRWQQRLGFLEGLGRRVWPMLAGVYVIRAVKRVSTVTPVKLRWHGLRVLSPGGVIEPSARRNGVSQHNEVSER